MLKNTKQRLTFKQGRGIASSWHVFAVLTLLLALLPLITWHQTRNANAQTTTEAPPVVTDGGTLATTPLPAGTPAAGTPVPVGTAVASDPAVGPADTTIVADGVDDQPGEPGRDGKDGRDGRDGADGQPGEPGQDGQDGQAGADAAASDSDRASDKDGKDREKKEKDRDRGRATDGRDANGNGGVADVVANPPRYDQQLDLEQQDGTNSTAGATGENGTVNGVPREEPVTAPVTTTGPGAPLAPGEVNLPPAVPGLPDPAAAGAEVTSPNVDPAIAAGVTGTTELVFDAVSDTTVFTAAPDAPQTPESAGLLALGGPDGAATLVSFDVAGIGDGNVLAARLTFVGAGSSGAPGGGVGVIYDYIAPDGLTARKAPGSETAMSVQGTPAWFERVEPGALGAVDVTGSVFGDGAVTFVFTGQPEETALIQAMESGAPPQLILTVALPA